MKLKIEKNNLDRVHTILICFFCCRILKSSRRYCCINEIVVKFCNSLFLFILIELFLFIAVFHIWYFENMNVFALCFASLFLCLSFDINFNFMDCSLFEQFFFSFLLDNVTFFEGQSVYILPKSFGDCQR